jgi:hypothetical protein
MPNKRFGTKRATSERKSQTPKPEIEELLLPSHEEAKTLCEWALRVKELAPWQWMEETDIFGIEDPDTGELGFISVMGYLGEYESVAVYRGAEGLYGFIDLHADPEDHPERVLEIPQVQVAFVGSEFLEKPDRDLLKGVGLKSRGAGPHLQFRSYRPGYHPWFVTREEARLLIHALSQTLNVVSRLIDGAHNFQVKRDGEGFLMREPRRDGNNLTWQDSIRKVARPAAKPVQFSVDDQILGDLKSVPRTELDLEADLFFAPAKIGERGARPMTMYLLMIADSESGFIFGLEAMTPEGSLPAMYGRFPETLARLLLQAKIVPKRLTLRSDRLLKMLEPLAKALKIQLCYAEELPSIDEAAASMEQMLTRS